MSLNHFITQVDLVNKSNRPYRELLKEQKIEAIKFCYGIEHQCNTVIKLIDDSVVTGWYYEEWGATLEEFMKNVNIKTDDELLETYIKWVEKVEEDLEKDINHTYLMECSTYVMEHTSK